VWEVGKGRYEGGIESTLNTASVCVCVRERERERSDVGRRNNETRVEGHAS